MLAPLAPWKHWLPELARFERVLVWNAGTQLFADCGSGKRLWVPMVEDARWAVFRIAKDASEGIIFYDGKVKLARCFSDAGVVSGVARGRILLGPRSEPVGSRAIPNNASGPDAVLPAL